MMQRMHWSPHSINVTSTPMKIIVNIRSHHTDYGRQCVCAYDVILQLYDDSGCDGNSVATFTVLPTES